MLIDGLADKIPARRAVRAFLEAMPGTIAMTPIDGPYVYRAMGGWAGFQLIAESHIAVHCTGLEVHVDIFSCMDFAVGPAIDLSVRMLSLDKIKTQTLQRGWALEALA